MNNLEWNRALRDHYGIVAPPGSVVFVPDDRTTALHDLWYRTPQGEFTRFWADGDNGIDVDKRRYHMGPGFLFFRVEIPQQEGQP